MLKDAGLDWKLALLAADIDHDVVNRPGGTVPARKELAFQLQFVALTKDRVDLWVRAARSYTLGSFGIRGLALVAAPNLEAWVRAAATDDVPGLVEVSPLRTSDGRLTGLEFTYPDAPDELVPFSIYRELVVTFRTFSWLYGEPFPFTHVDIPLPTLAPEVSTIVACSVKCDSEALRVWWEPEASLHELPFGNEFQYTTWVHQDTRILEVLRETGDWPSTVEKVIRAAPHLNRKLANAAAALRVSPRTLQRKLELTGHDFAQVRDATLGTLASELLAASNHSVSQISRVLGYSDPASFTSAFKRWKGTSPTAYRDASPSVAITHSH
ncbi:AraC family transcriptional regulator [Microbacterium sp. cx-55]|uniref:AraC family transcriptional regulator n=1 Tax=Microbacterium sp. cx-55 TaxID=2875948 RepID=UPI001CBF1DAD|nr:AraC family transcriptional regulator [Microbacterium sp. cx-55]MBZ4486766.1 AraC family transcriptional regulator [Microbacterium sp. cx-55]